MRPDRWALWGSQGTSPWPSQRSRRTRGDDGVEKQIGQTAARSSMFLAERVPWSEIIVRRHMTIVVMMTLSACAIVLGE